MSTLLKSRARQFIYLAVVLIGAVFVLTYRGPFWVFIRSYAGDWLIVQFIYVIARFWISYRWRYRLAIGIMVFALATEIVQFIGTGIIPRNFAMEVTIGSTFDPGDLLAYVLGLITVLMIDHYWRVDSRSLLDGNSV
jgi:hypothetical protein